MRIRWRGSLLGGGQLQWRHPRLLFLAGLARLADPSLGVFGATTCMALILLRRQLRSPSQAAVMAYQEIVTKD